MIKSTDTNRDEVMTNSKKQVSVLEEECGALFLDINVTISFIIHDEETIEITSLRVSGTGEEIDYYEIQFRKYASVDYITAEKYLENEVVTYLGYRS